MMMNDWSWWLMVAAGAVGVVSGLLILAYPLRVAWHNLCAIGRASRAAWRAGRAAGLGRWTLCVEIGALVLLSLIGRVPRPQAARQAPGFDLPEDGVVRASLVLTGTDYERMASCVWAMHEHMKRHPEVHPDGQAEAEALRVLHKHLCSALPDDKPQSEPAGAPAGVTLQ